MICFKLERNCLNSNAKHNGFVSPTRLPTVPMKKITVPHSSIQPPVVTSTFAIVVIHTCTKCEC